MNTQSTKRVKPGFDYRIYPSLEEHLEGERKNYLTWLSDLEKTGRRLRRFEKYLKDRFPANLKRKVEIQASMGTWTILIDIYLKKTVRDKNFSTIQLVDWAVDFANSEKGWKFKKQFSESSGSFTYHLDRRFSYPGSDYRITISNPENIDDCKIKQVRRMRKVWITDCENGEVK